jgi:hypothetical protein
VSLDSVQVDGCYRHPKQLTAVRCSKCNTPICTRCMVPTPVGARCRECANVRKLPQYDIDVLLLARASAGGLIASVVVWLVVSGLPFLRFFLSILVGFAVGEIMSRLSRRRSNLALEISAVLMVVIGFLAVEVWRFAGSVEGLASALALAPSFLIATLIPVAIASFVAVVKLR